jgi:hypothetical protein
MGNSCCYSDLKNLETEDGPGSHSFELEVINSKINEMFTTTVCGCVHENLDANYYETSSDYSNNMNLDYV